MGVGGRGVDDRVRFRDGGVTVGFGGGAVLSVALEMAGRVKLGFSSSLVGAGLGGWVVVEALGGSGLLSVTAALCWEVEERSSRGLVLDWSQFGLSLRKILLWLATCFAVFEPTSSASLMLEEGPSLARASRNSRCSPSVHKVLWTESDAWAARCSLAAAACWFCTCCARDFLFERFLVRETGSAKLAPLRACILVSSRRGRGSSVDLGVMVGDRSSGLVFLIGGTADEAL